MMTDTLDPTRPMREILAEWPGAQRALFRGFHLGGCSSCGFSPDETLEQLCARNPHASLAEVLPFLAQARAEDERVLLAPEDLRARLGEGDVRLLDLRTREEFDAVHIPGAVHFTQPLMNEVMMSWPREGGMFVLMDHRGERVLDAAAYFAGHGFANVRALRGGVDAFAALPGSGLPRYELDAET